MNKNLKILLIFLTLFPLIAFGQGAINGTVIDGKTKQAVSFATVYINGTTQGTTTDEKGSFSIKLVTVPCQLVVSHVSYEPWVLDIEGLENDHQLVTLKQRFVEIEEVTVKSKNLRQKNINEFKMWFLGMDDWGKNAELLNEDALFFSRDRVKKTLKVRPSMRGGNNVFLSNAHAVSGSVEWSNDSTELYYHSAINLKAHAREPLKVHLPLLGYTVYVELLDFLVQYETKQGALQSAFLGYYYFVPAKTEKKREIKKFTKNRLAAYYNSSQHFCRSLYQNELKQNGYQLFEQLKDSLTNEIVYKEVQIDDHFRYADYDQLQIVGLRDKHYHLFYYPNSNGRPKNLITQKPRQPVQSEIYFLSDTCTINRNGIIPNNTIVFGGVISEKKVGSMLPEDYQVLLK